MYSTVRCFHNKLQYNKDGSVYNISTTNVLQNLYKDLQKAYHTLPFWCNYVHADILGEDVRLMIWSKNNSQIITFVIEWVTRDAYGVYFEVKSCHWNHVVYCIKIDPMQLNISFSQIDV